MGKRRVWSILGWALVLVAVDLEDWVEKIGHEWVGFLAALVLQRTC